MKTMIEVMPAAAAATRSARPVVVPASVTKPPRKPWRRVLAIISAMFGPGVRASNTQAAMNARSTWADMGSAQRSA